MTNSTVRIFLEHLKIMQLIKTSLTSWTLSFTTVITKAHHYTPSWSSSIKILVFWVVKLHHYTASQPRSRL